MPDVNGQELQVGDWVLCVGQGYMGQEGRVVEVLEGEHLRRGGYFAVLFRNTTFHCNKFGCNLRKLWSADALQDTGL